MEVLQRQEEELKTKVGNFTFLVLRLMPLHSTGAVKICCLDLGISRLYVNSSDLISDVNETTGDALQK